MNSRRSPAVGISDLLSTEIAEVLDGSVVMSSQTFALAVRVANGGVNVGSTSFKVSNPTWLTDAQLRATPVPVIFPATQQIIVGEVEVKNDAGNPVPVQGTISLSTGTLAALETINAVQSGTWTVAVSTGSLAALEQIGVRSTSFDIRSLSTARDKVNAAQLGTWSVGVTNFSTEVKVTNSTAQRIPVTSTGTISLSAASLAALEAITVQNTTAARVPVTSTGTVGLNAATLAALESITATVANPTTAVRVTNSTSQRVPVSLPSTQVIVVGEVEVKNDSGNPVPVSGTITQSNTTMSLAAASLAALESITVQNTTSGRVPGRVTQDGTWTVTQANTTMSLSAGTLSALESISVQNTTGAAVPTVEQNVLVPKKFDFIDLGYSTGGNLTSAVYKAGGSGGATVATLALAYTTGGLLDTVTRS